MVDEKKQQECLTNFRHYIQNSSEVKKDLEKLKSEQITDLEKSYQELDALHAKHSANCYAASGYYGAGNLHEISGCGDDLNEYNKSVNELYNLKNEFYKKLKATRCAYCKKKNLNNPYIYKEEDGHKTVFCNQTCLDKWSQEQSKYTCEWCKQNKSGKYWYPVHQGKLKKGERILGAGKFCSEDCVNLWQENKKQSLAKEKASKEERNQNLPPCPQCHQLLTEWAWTQEEAKDSLQFCSDKCCTDYYVLNPCCDNCGNIAYQQPYQWTTWKELPVDNYYYGASVKKLIEYYETQLNKTFSKDYSKKYCSAHCFCLNNGIDVNNWSKENIKTYWKWINEKNNKQVDCEREQDANQIKNLKSQINQLENQTNSQNTQNNNSNLYLGIGGVVFGLGLIGLVVWLILRERKS